MATTSYESALRMAASLSREEQLRLIRELASRTGEERPSETRHSILELRGLGREIWNGIDAQEFVRQERSSWNG